METFAEEVRAKLMKHYSLPGYHWVNLDPHSTLSLGDFGAFRDGVWERYGNIVGLDHELDKIVKGFAIQRTPFAARTFNYNESCKTSLLSKLDGTMQQLGLKANLTFSYTFSGEKDVFWDFQHPEKEEYAQPDLLCKALVNYVTTNPTSAAAALWNGKKEITIIISRVCGFDGFAFVATEKTAETTVYLTAEENLPGLAQTPGLSPAVANLTTSFTIKCTGAVKCVSNSGPKSEKAPLIPVFGLWEIIDGKTGPSQPPRALF